MMLVQKLMNRAFGKHEARALMLALDASGRTTMLYKWKLGEVVTTIPTIGFNVETINYRDLDLTVWDVGGCDKIRPLWRHYFQNTHILIWFQSLTDWDRLDEATEELRKALREDELKGIPCAVFFTKFDVPGIHSPEEFMERMNLKELLKTREWAYVVTSSKDNDSLHQALDCVYRLVKKVPPSVAAVVEKKEDEEEKLYRVEGRAGLYHMVSQNGAQATVQSLDGGQPEEMLSKAVTEVSFTPNAKKTEEVSLSRSERQAEGMASMFIGWLRRQDESDDVFIGEIENASYHAWDHYTHLRLAYVLLSRHGRPKAIPMIFSYIRNFIEKSTRTNGKTFHVTMTYFWCHMIDFAIKSSSIKGVGADWKSFLLMNPQLANGGMYLHYYSKDVMMTPKAKEVVVLPDKRPLPSLLTDTSRQKLDNNNNNVVVFKEPLPTMAFLTSVSQGTMESWSHESYLRVIFEILLEYGRPQGKDLVFTYLKGIEKAHFNLTLAYFWMQMMHLALARKGLDVQKPVEAEKRPPFLLLMRDEFGDDQMYKKYYSDNVLFEDGKEHFVPPDKCQFPMK